MKSSSPFRCQILTALGALLLFAATGPYYVLGDDSVNFISNGNFESDHKTPGWPDDWGRAKDKTISWEKEGDNHFLRLHSEQAGQTVMAYREIAVPDGTKALELKWRWRVTDLKPGKQSWFDARIMMDFKNDAGQKVKPSPAAPYLRKSTDGWVQGSVHFLVPDGARTLQFMPALFQVESGTMDLDDIVLAPVDAAPLQKAAAEAAAATAAKIAKLTEARRAKAKAAVQSDGSLIANGNLEVDAKGKGWPDGWGSAKSQTIAWEKEGDNHFLRLQTSEPGKGTMLYRTVDIPTGVEALTLSWRQRITGLKKGKLPWNDARIMMDFLDGAGHKLAQKPSPPYSGKDTKGWEDKSTTFLVPKEAVTLVIMPSLFQVSAGTFDLDDISLKPAEAAPLIAAAKAAAEAEKKAYLAPETPNTAKWPEELHVEGKQVLNKDGKPVWLQGMNVVSLEFLLRGDHLLKSIEVGIDDWKANIIRLPVKGDYWLGRSPEQTDGGVAYRALVDSAITLAANHGAYVLLDLHRFGSPKQDDIDFWKDAGAKYKNHPAVIFDLFNEPHGTTWEIWRNGGFIAEKKKAADEDSFLTPEDKAKAAKGYQGVGMQALLNTVREVGAKNVVVVGGLDWSYDLSGIANGFALEDKGGNGIIYASHIYPWKRDWKDKALAVVDKYPLLLGEVGADIHKMDFIPKEAQEDPYTWVPDMLGLIQKYKLHWTGFSFHPKASPVMIEDWSYKPTPYWGAFAKRALAGEKFELQKMR
ncbi:glycoside hydrolase family 5 [Chthoniobacter flavus Ellin428]|uniref:Glycoside hydrolase family 5 n=1 Tax=Chthoniobacter flavus Ellin428 TaxID=497964 RepID=B4D828_9BACT|nr:cellulase family glycosylhydrolase [Chthoniobacter flavus]EDY17382.1 glycoside hydrolase family 5 [Chthoniobacter flavus Ellin428]TCO87369.1 cellulase (glycosyl hydrolase family 5) [Chthoniobacter flavus]